MHIEVENWMSEELKAEIELYNKFVSEAVAREEEIRLAEVPELDVEAGTPSGTSWYAAAGVLFRIRMQMDSEMVNLKRVQATVSAEIQTFFGDSMESRPF